MDDPRNRLKYPDICHQCLNTKPSAGPTPTNQPKATTTNKKVVSKKASAGTKKATGKKQKTPPKKKDTAATTAATSKKTAGKLKFAKMKQVAPIIPNCTPLAFNMEPELIEEHESWIEESHKIPRAYMKRVNGKLYLFGNVIQCTSRKEGKYKVEFSHTNIDQTGMQAYPLYKANELWKSLQNGPGARPRSNVFHLGESILSDCACDSDDKEDVAQENQRTRSPL